MNSRYSIEPLNFEAVVTYPLESRKSKVNVEMFGKPMDGTENVPGLIAKLPRILAAENLRVLIQAILDARASSKAILWGIGGHVIKVGLGPVLVDLMKSGFVTGIAMNGSAAIHDLEVAFGGSTSEEVAEQIGEGKFGMAKETGEYFNEAARAADQLAIGLGESLGKFITESGENKIHFAHAADSVLAAAYANRIPVSIHVAIGTDIVHAHPAASGRHLGESTHHDFRLFCAMTQNLDGGGVYLNVGSAVVLPEVFLKAVSVVRNLSRLEDFTTANLDFIQHYRPTQNVLKRPTLTSGRAIALTGHHEIMVPLIAAALKSSLSA